MSTQPAGMQSILDVFPYGAPDLQRLYKKYLTRAMMVAVGMMLLAVGSWFAAKLLASDDAPEVRIRMIDPTELGPPPSIDKPAPPPIKVAAPVIAPSVAIPVPVPDELVPEEQTIATQEEMQQVAAPVLEGLGGDSLVIDPGAFGGDDEPGMEDYVAVEVEPVPIKQVAPEYPRIAREAEIEGKVIVKALVDKEGKVSKVVVVDGPEIFQSAALAAAKQWVFKPAIMGGKPVKVWVAIPFRFRLN